MWPHLTVRRERYLLLRPCGLLIYVHTRPQVPPNVTVNFQAFSVAPTLLWWVPLESMDLALDVVALTGMVLAFLLVMLGSGNALIFGMLWILYHSLVNVGQRW